MPLTDAAIRQAKPSEKPCRLFDGDGLYLEVAPRGGKWWRLKYRLGGKEKRLSLGVYPEVGLKEARARRDKMRQQIAQGIDPGAVRKAVKVSASGADTFETVAREWFAKFSPGWAPAHADKTIQRLQRDIFPWLGSRPVREVTAPELLAVLRRIEERGAIETAHRAKQNCGQVFRYAIATGRADRDPSADLRGALPPAREEHMPSITDPRQVGPLLRALDGYEGSFVTKCALRLAPLTFVRPGELRTAEWAEFNLETAEWCLPGEKMKMGEPHIVPLCRQAVAILMDLHPLTGNGRYLFPGARTTDRPMSDNTVLSALRRLGYAKEEMTGHGFRAMARTLLDEVLGFRVELIEHQLAHAVRDPLGRAYNRTTHLPERRAMMQAWANYLDELKNGADVISLRKRG